MIITTVLASLAVAAVQDAPVVLERKFTAGDRFVYKFNTKTFSDDRDYQFDMFMPNTQESMYTATTDVLEVKPSGAVVCRWVVSDAWFILGENASRDEMRIKDKEGADYRVEVTQVNDILDMRDNRPPKPEKNAPKTEADWMRSLMAAAVQPTLDQWVGQYVGPIYQLAGFTGGPYSGLDFAPKLPLDEVKVGDTWKKTVGFSPQKLRNDKDKKMAVTRLDYTYTYRGLVEEDGKKYLKITSACSLKTDVNDFLGQLMGSQENSPMSKAPLTWDAKVEYWLDPVTLHTINIEASSEGKFEMWVKEIKEQAYQESRLRSKASYKLVSLGKTPKTPAKASKPRG